MYHTAPMSDVVGFLGHSKLNSSQEKKTIEVLHWNTFVNAPLVSMRLRRPQGMSHELSIAHQAFTQGVQGIDMQDICLSQIQTLQGKSTRRRSLEQSRVRY
jgi:hypothetical protein